MSNPGTHRVAWRSKLTGAEGHGDPLAQETAAAWVEKMNLTYPDLDHWIEPVDALDSAEAHEPPAPTFP